MSQEKYADKIAKLLRQAEGTDNDNEREAFIAKAQELMIVWAIDDEMLAKARGENLQEREEIVREYIEYKGSYSRALFDIGAAIARANTCRILISTGYGGTTLTIVGHKSDVDRVKLLDASLQIQAASAMQRWWKEARDRMKYYSASEKFRARRDFLFGFASGLSMQLVQANKLGKEEAAKNEAERQRITQEDASSSVELALVDKKKRVDNWMDETYGKLSSSRSVSKVGYTGGYGAGTSAGRRADLGRPAVGARKSLSA